VGNKGLDKESAEDSCDGFDLNGLGSASLNPLASLSPSLVESKQTALTTALDQLIGLGDKLGAGDQEPRVGDLSLIKDILDSLVIGEVERCETGRRVVCSRGGERGRLDHWGASEVVVDDGLAVGLVDSFGGHNVCMGIFFGEMKEREKGKELKMLKGKVKKLGGNTGVYSVQYQKKSCAGSYSVQLGRSHCVENRPETEDQWWGGFECRWEYGGRIRLQYP
jgi:hypothetical protein